MDSDPDTATNQQWWKQSTIDEDNHPERNANDDIIAERLDQPSDRDIPKNITEALKHEESAIAAKREMEMIQKFGTWN